MREWRSSNNRYRQRDCDFFKAFPALRVRHAQVQKNAHTTKYDCRIHRISVAATTSE